MKTIRIPIILITGLLIAPAMTSAQSDAPEIPKGTLKVDGSKFRYGETPTLSWTITKPLVAKDVIEIKNSASLDIKVDSTIKIEVIGIGLSERNDQSRARVYVNGSASFFYLGSQNNVGGLTDWYWEPTGRYVTLTDLQSYHRHNPGQLERPTSISDWGKPVSYNPIPLEDRTIEVKANDEVNIVTEFWGNKYHLADSRTEGQTQMISFFDGDDIPLTKTGDPNQTDLVDMLNNGLIKKVGDNKYEADISDNQVITMVDYSSTAVDINDMVYLLEVTGKQTLQSTLLYDYYIVKTDRTKRVVQYDDDGKLIPFEDDDGTTGIDPGSDTFGFDEIHKITGNEQADPNDADRFTYKFNTPNGVYGSDYQLIAIYRGIEGGGGGGTPPDSGVVVPEDTEYELAKLFLDSYGIFYSFELQNLIDPNKRLLGDADSEVASLNSTSLTKYTFDTRRKTAGFITKPLILEALKTTPKGAYSMYFEHKLFTYAEGSTSIEEGIEETEEQIIVTEGELLSEDIVGNKIDTLASLVSMGDQGKNTEEHFNTYAYLAVWALVEGAEQIVGYTKNLIDHQTLQTWASPTATLTLTSLPDNGIAYRNAPYFESNIKNIYPDAEVKVLMKSLTGDKVVTMGFPAYSKSQTVATLETTKLYTSADPGAGQYIGQDIPDGAMRYEVVHYIDFDNDGTVDDERIIATQTWTLDRSIKVRGSSINTSE